MTLALERPRRGFGKADLAVFMFAALFAVCMLLPFVMPLLSAGEIQTLTDMFETRSFRGSAEALSNANFIGQILHYIISWFSFLGLCLTLYQKFITLLYLSSRNLFDAVYDVKTTKMKDGLLGYKGLVTSLLQGDNGSKGAGGGGLDVFITFIYSLLPNIKAYCDFAPEALDRNKLTEDMGVTNYMLKTAPSTIILVFFLTIGYSGTLAKAYGTVVDGMAVAADHLVSQNLSAWVKQQLVGMGGYNFTLGTVGTEQANYANEVSQEMFNLVLENCSTNIPESFKKSLGTVVENTVVGGAGAVSAAFVPGGMDTSGGILGGTVGLSSSENAGDLVNERLSSLIMASLPEYYTTTDGGDLSSFDYLVREDSDYSRLRSPQMFTNPSPQASGSNTISWSMDEIVQAAYNLAGSSGDELSDFRVPGTNTYIHLAIEIDVGSNASYITIPQGGDSGTSGSANDQDLSQ